MLEHARCAMLGLPRNRYWKLTMTKALEDIRVIDMIESFELQR